jgi:hypothetical protein
MARGISRGRDGPARLERIAVPSACRFGARGQAEIGAGTVRHAEPVSDALERLWRVVRVLATPASRIIYVQTAVLLGISMMPPCQSRMLPTGR